MLNKIDVLSKNILTYYTPMWYNIITKQHIYARKERLYVHVGGSLQWTLEMGRPYIQHAGRCRAASQRAGKRRHTFQN